MVELKIIENKGITTMLETHVNQLIEDGKAESSDGKISSSEWKQTLKVLSDINDKKEPPIFLGKANYDEKDWHNNYVIPKDGRDTISFTEDEMKRLYDAMGITIKLQNTNIVSELKNDEEENIQSSNNGYIPLVELDDESKKKEKNFLVCAGIVLTAFSALAITAIRKGFLH